MYAKYFKVALDMLLATLMLPFLFVCFLVIGPLIKLEDRGPIIFKSPRLGTDMVPYHMWKFRSMKVDAPDFRATDGRTINSADDPRVTRIGKTLRSTSLDEIPQIINVLRGQMSFIGPRPSPLGNEDKYTVEYLRKFNVKPGITGHSQSLHRNEVTLKQRQREDLEYVERISFGFDLVIALRTIRTVMGRSGVYNSPSDTANGDSSGRARDA